MHQLILRGIKGPNILIFCSKRFQESEDGKSIFTNITLQGYKLKLFTKITSNPSILDLKYCCSELTNFVPDSIIAIGGGSTLDLAKAYKAFKSTSLDYEEYCERICQNKDLNIQQNIYSVAIPTTSGTGSEVTPFATIWDCSRKERFPSIQIIFTLQKQ